DDFELIRSQRRTAERVTVWDAKAGGNNLKWGEQKNWPVVWEAGQALGGTPVFQTRHLAGMFHPADGGLNIYALDHDGKANPRGALAPSPAFKATSATLVKSGERTGIRVNGENGQEAYTAWLLPSGVIRVEAKQVPRFTVRDAHVRHAILPSFAGTDLVYSAGKISGDKAVNIPSTQWLTGLVAGNDCMLVTVWDSDAQAVTLGATGEGDKRVIDSLTIDTTKGGVAVSFVEHANLWHQEKLLEDWLGDYTPISWTRPFPARWHGEFFATPGGEPTFKEPFMAYSFPVANAKTRMWGAWFEDWNHYPFYLDGPKTVVHFEKSFVPTGDALIYFLEPAAADLYSPVEIVEQALGVEKAAALLDFEANRLRQLAYSTPNEFMYDRPVCATTTRLGKIKAEDKPTVGVNLATHLYEFIREIRGRVDQYNTWFAQTRDYLAREQAAHPGLKTYVAELDALLAEGQARAKSAYNTPLANVEAKTDAMKKQLSEGKGDGFDCGSLDVRGPAGTQDDLCRRFNRLVLRLTQTAALKCDDSPEKAVIAKHIWDESRALLRRPTRWEPRRTLYFFEP
ncbi:MAG TPA: hypothetical protein VHH73_16730, partial [Verrucomicrobiae bacterium]|nr:hypothetical protein [Verrucomicrobiae bacterium]